MLQVCRLHDSKIASLFCLGKQQVWKRKLHTSSLWKRSLSRKGALSVSHSKVYFSLQYCKKPAGYVNSLSLTKGIFIPLRHMSSVKNHYEVLGLGQTASSDDIRAAFLKRSKECHPDLNRLNPDNHRQFVQVNEAYSVLSRPQTRKRYDSTLNHSVSTTGHATPYSDFYRHPNQTSQEEWLRQNGLKEEYFRHTAHQQYSSRGANKISNVHIVVSCFVFMLTGIIFHIIAVKLSSDKHIQNLNDRDLRTHELWMNAKKAAKEFTPRELTQHLLDKKESHPVEPGR